MVDEQAVVRRRSPIPGIRPKAGRVAVAVDASRCTGQGVCVALAAAGFALDRFGYAYVLPGTSERSATDRTLRGALRDAEARCPERAIRVTDVVDPPPPAPVARPAVPAAATPATATPATVAPATAGSGPAGLGSAGFVPRLLLPDGGAESLEWWVAQGGFSAPGPVPLADEVARTGLIGHGGGGFPVAAKWRAARGLQPPVVVANGAEREPGSLKDRHLMARRPLLVLDGLRATAAAVGARRAFVGVDEEATAALDAMAAAVRQASEAGLLGDLEVAVRPVPARYVAGEETALISVLDGGEAKPTAKPPYPSQSGLAGRPTVVHNIETLAQVGLIAAFGADWFCRAGAADAPGTGLFSVGRFGGTMAVVERPSGTTVRQLVDDAGWPDARAALVGGWSGTLLPADRFDLPLTGPAVAAAGGVLGTKSVQVLVDGDCPVATVATVLGYLAGETAGQCPPCTRGVPYLAGLVSSLARGTLRAGDLADGRAFAASLVDRGACRLPDGAVRLLGSLFRHFPADVDRHLAGAACPTMFS
ncbi:MAG TPA: NADH-ubiquinone oxidoreductase-F iron-sulfur binding region domain-containing protein [Acidimicrobiales bacterium]|nr:NADH-ubiquinone oxidoreductase-F iron-sulfur binding region domain-containing protein [Acidimicrobiales bacterium]